MKPLRYSVQADPDGFGVWEVCPDVLAHGECRYALWCQCVHSDGGPLHLRAKVCGTLSEALACADVFEAGNRPHPWGTPCAMEI